MTANKPDARCVDCNATFATFRPGVGNLLRWRCSSCGGHLLLHLACQSCGETVDRKTGFRGVYGRLLAPNTCDHCGDKVGFANDLPWLFGDQPYSLQPFQWLLNFTSLRFRLAFVFLFFGMVTGFVGLIAGLLVGVFLIGGLYSAGMFANGPILGLSPTQWTSLVVAAFVAAGVWYGWRAVNAEINQQDPELLTDHS